jgi:hypothetical protein
MDHLPSSALEFCHRQGTPLTRIVRIRTDQYARPASRPLKTRKISTSAPNTTLLSRFLGMVLLLN